MIHYSFNLIQDIKRQYGVFFKRRKFIASKKIYFIYPTPIKFFKLLFFPPKSPKNDEKSDIKCFWVTGGTRGGFHPPDVIHICPFQKYSNKYVNEQELRRVILHELMHLKCWAETKNMTFEDREKFVNDKAKEDI